VCCQTCSWVWVIWAVDLLTLLLGRARSAQPVGPLGRRRRRTGLTEVLDAGYFKASSLVLPLTREAPSNQQLSGATLTEAPPCDPDIPEQLAQLLGEPCMKLAEGIKAYISKARTMPRLFNTSGSRLGQVTQRPSAHLTLRDTNSLGFPSLPSPTPGLHQSCRHVVRSWANQSFVGAHLHNMTLTNGQAAGARRTGGYYLVIPQVRCTFRYPVPRPGRRGPTQRSAQPTQLVPVRSTKRDVLPPSPIQLLKGVGTKCWAPGRRVRAALRLPGGPVRAEGRRRALRLRLLAHHGQRRRLLQLLRRLPPGPLRAPPSQRRWPQAFFFVFPSNSAPIFPQLGSGGRTGPGGSPSHCLEGARFSCT
ncbi:unnamed protein product, partial [Tetraodon nigroviridis]